MRAYEDIPIEDTDNDSLNTAQLNEVNETFEEDINDKLKPVFHRHTALESSPVSKRRTRWLPWLISRMFQYFSDKLIHTLSSDYSDLN